MSTSGVPLSEAKVGVGGVHTCGSVIKACSSIVCDFNGSCGEAFPKATDLLDHIAVHLGDESIIEEIHQEDDLDFPYGLRGLSRVSKPVICSQVKGSLKDSSHSLQFQIFGPNDGLSSSPASGVDVGMGTMQLFPELSYMLHRHQPDAYFDADMSGPFVRMEEILTESSGDESNYSSEDSWHENINWHELLQNESSASDWIDYDDWIKNLPDCEDDTWLQDENDQNVSKDTGKETQDGAYANFKTIPSGGKNLRLLQSSANYESGSQKPRGFHVLKESNQLNSRKEMSASNRQRRFENSENIEQPPCKHVNKKTQKRNGRRVNVHANVQYYSAEFILQEGLKKRRGNYPANKPYMCPVPDCGKAYKNPNGIKYHARYGHSAPQEFPCYCGKIYSTRHGLMAHRRAHSSVYNSPASTGEYLSFSETEESDES